MLIHATVWGLELEFETSPTSFSPRWVDRGTLALLGRVGLTPDDRVLDLGCGYGVIGIAAARVIGADRVVMIDSNADAVELARANAKRNGIEGVRVQQSFALRDTRETGFTHILCNPPYHESFGVPKEFILKGFNRLVVGGCFWLVTKRRIWYENKLRAVFGRVTVAEVDGYFVFEAEKRSPNYAQRFRRD